MLYTRGCARAVCLVATRGPTCLPLHSGMARLLGMIYLDAAWKCYSFNSLHIRPSPYMSAIHSCRTIYNHQPQDPASRREPPDALLHYRSVLLRQLCSYRTLIKGPGIHMRPLTSGSIFLQQRGAMVQA